MNPKHFNIRIDRRTGEFFLVHEKPHSPIRKIRNVTSEVLLALCADLFETENTAAVERDIRFSDGGIVRLTVRDLGTETQEHGAQPQRSLIELPPGYQPTVG